MDTAIRYHHAIRPFLLYHGSLLFCHGNPAQDDVLVFLPAHFPNGWHPAHPLGHADHQRPIRRGLCLCRRFSVFSRQLLLDEVGRRARGQVYQHQCAGLGKCDCQYHPGLLDAGDSVEQAAEATAALEKEGWRRLNVLRRRIVSFTSLSQPLIFLWVRYRSNPSLAFFQYHCSQYHPTAVISDLCKLPQSNLGPVVHHQLVRHRDERGNHVLMHAHDAPGPYPDVHHLPGNHRESIREWRRLPYLSAPDEEPGSHRDEPECSGQPRTSLGWEGGKRGEV